MTLREVCGLTTEQVAAAFLTTATTLAQRIVRAKSKIATRAFRTNVPERSDLPERLASVLHVVYLVFNQGLFQSGPSRVRGDPAGAAAGRAAPEPEAIGLLALMLLHDARRATRTSAAGELVRSKSRIARSGTTPR